MEPLDPYVFGAEQTCFGCGPHNPRGLHLRFFRDGDEVVADYTAPDGYDGPPGILHGGLQATLADEVGAWTLVGVLGRFGLTTSVQLRYLRPARIGVPIQARGRITSRDESRVSVQVKLVQEGKNLLSGRIAYVIPTLAAAEQILGQTLPPTWAALTRG